MKPSSRIRRLWILIGWIGVAVVIYLSLKTHPPQVLPIDHGNRIGHTMAYASLMFWFAQLTDRAVQRRLYAGALIALAIAIEFAQLATPFRTFSYLDMLAGGLGVVIGWSVAFPRSPNLLSLAERVADRRVGLPR